MESQSIKIADLIRDPSLQVRESLDQKVIDRYAEAMCRGDQFPPVKVFSVGGKLYLADGWYRTAACEKNGMGVVTGQVYPGAYLDALRYALGANSEHGLPRTDQEEVRAICMALDVPEWRAFSDHQISDICHVSRARVVSVRSAKEETVVESYEKKQEDKAKAAKPKKPKPKAEPVPEPKETNPPEPSADEEDDGFGADPEPTATTPPAETSAEEEEDADEDEEKVRTEDKAPADDASEERAIRFFSRAASAVRNLQHLMQQSGAYRSQWNLDVIGAMAKAGRETSEQPHVLASEFQQVAAFLQHLASGVRE